MLTLEEMTTVTPIMAMIRGIKDTLTAIDEDQTLSEVEDEELYMETTELFIKLVKAMLSHKELLLVCDVDTAEVHILDTTEELEQWKEGAERLFAEYPLHVTNDPEMDAFKARNRFTCKISLEQLVELAGSDFYDPNNFYISECGTEFTFVDLVPIAEARSAGEL